ncbi:MAG: IclR family transcriptional regulator [Pseudomonadota bacterium]
MNKVQGIQVISRAARILRILGGDGNGLSLGQIAKQVQLPRSTVQRIVNTLIAEGFASTDGGQGGIRLGPEIRTLAQSSAFDLKAHFRPLLQEIADATRETVDLAVLEGRRMRFIDQIVGNQRLRTVSSIGETFPLTTTANGKAALGALAPQEAEKLIMAELAEMPEHNVQLETLLPEIAQARSGRLASDRDEHTEGVSALGFAVTGPNSEIVAISIPVPSSRFLRVEASLKQQLNTIRKRSGL